MMRQMWACTVCGCERQWGAAPRPIDAPPEPFLYCSHCVRLTKHRYSKISLGETGSAAHAS